MSAGGIFGQAQFENVTKQRQGDNVRRYLYGASSTLAVIRKEPRWPGKRIEEVKCKTAWGGGGGSTFSDAANNQQYGEYDKFLVPQAILYQIGTIDHHEAMATATGEGSPLKLVDESLEDAWEGFAQRMSTRLWKDQGLSLARVKAVNANKITLYDPRDTVYFTLNMRLQASANDGNGAGDVLYGPQYVCVEAVDEEAGIITVDDATLINPPTGLAADDYLFAFSDFKKGWLGIPAWIPPVAPVLGTPFLGVDRAKYLSRLSGTRDVATQAIRPALIKFLGKIARVGGKPDCIIFNSERHAELIGELDADSEITIEVGRGARGRNDMGPTFSFKAPAIQTQFGLLPILHDRYAPWRYAWAIKKDSWRLKSLGAVPHYSKEDGHTLRVLDSSDSSQYRLRGWGNFICDYPWHNGVLDLDGS